MNREPIVIDTNVFISFALTSTTTPALAVEYAINNFIILQSPATIGELVTKLLLPKFERYITLEQRRQLLLTLPSLKARDSLFIQLPYLLSFHLIDSG
ncbi:MAG: putative toxin-antitoxin system toxin component, PIN family [Microcystis aeruginosa G13-07]|nr:putative toxin-antitoxin system toxin component, PIN family [Microcystis aeruginosa G13-07]